MPWSWNNFVILHLVCWLLFFSEQVQFEEILSEAFSASQNRTGPISNHWRDEGGSYDKEDQTLSEGSSYRFLSRWLTTFHFPTCCQQASPKTDVWLGSHQRVKWSILRLSDETDSTWKGSWTRRKFPMWLTEMVSFKTPFSSQTERFSQLNRASAQITPLKCQRQSKKVWKPRPLCLTHSHGAERALKLESRLTVRELRVWEIYCDKKKRRETPKEFQNIPLGAQ